MNDKYRIIFLRNRSYHPIGCVVIKLGKTIVEYNLSVLNPRDNFNRSLAKEIAMGRLDTTPITVNLPLNANMHDIAESVMIDIACSNSVPVRATKAASDWLKGLIVNPNKPKKFEINSF